MMFCWLKFKNVISWGVVFAFCFMLYSCDFSDHEHNKEVSLKGDKITGQVVQEMAKHSHFSSNENKPLEYYSVNVNSPKAEEVKKKIISNLEKIRSKDEEDEISSVKSPEKFDPNPDMGNGVIIENTKTGREALVTPIDNGIKTVTQRTLSPYDSETNTINPSKMLSFRAETNLSKSELSAIEENPNHVVTEHATLQIEIKDQDGNIRYSSSLINGANGINSKKGISHSNQQDQTLSCFGHCMNRELNQLENAGWAKRVYCIFFGPYCAAAMLSQCTIECFEIWWHNFMWN